MEKLYTSKKLLKIAGGEIHPPRIRPWTGVVEKMISMLQIERRA